MLERFLPEVLICLATSLALPLNAAEQPIPISAFVKRSMFDMPRLSPDGKYLALRVNAEIDGRDTKMMSVYELAGFKPVSTMRMPNFELPIDFRWVSNTRLVVTKAQDQGYLEVPVYLGEIVATDFDGQRQSYIYGYRRTSYKQGGAATALDDYGWGYIQGIPGKADGSFLLRERKWDRDRAVADHTLLYSVNASNGIRTLVADVGARDLNFLVQHDAKPRLAFGSSRNLQQLAFIRDKDEDKWAPIPRNFLGKHFEPMAFTPDDKEIFILLSEDGGPNKLILQSMVDGKRKLLGADEINDIDVIQFGPGRQQPFAYGTSAGKPQLRYLDEKSPEAVLHKQLSAQFPGQYVEFASFSADGSKLLFTVSSDKEPGEFYLYASATKSAEFLVAVRPWIDPARMAERMPIQFKARDGLELYGYLTLPPGSSGRNLPLILLPHGGPQGVSDHWYWDSDAQFLASRGYGVLQVNYRGSSGRGDSYVRIGMGQWSEGMIHDLIDGVRWTIGQGIADESRICAYGGSYGAYASMISAIAEPGLFKCVVGYAGLYDLPELLSDRKVKGKVFAFNFLVEAIGLDMEILRKNSPSFQVDKIKVPVLLVHGEQDEVTPKAQAEAMRAALDRANKPYEWMMVPKEGHGFYAEKNRIAFYEKLEAFLNKHIGLR
jgi:dipeptidyl aminopeptidase/acylaminoacyl peptidase